MAISTNLYTQKLLEQHFDFENLTHQMTDAHADYYDCVINGTVCEVKVVNNENEGFETGYSVSYREEGKEDWNYMDTIEA